MKFISYNSRLLYSQEQKLSTLARELLGIVDALLIYEFHIIESPHPTHLFTDRKHLLHCFTKKGSLIPRFYRAQMQLTNFSKLIFSILLAKISQLPIFIVVLFTKTELQLNHLKNTTSTTIRFCYITK